MKFKKTDFIAIAILIAALVHLVIAYPDLPAQLPTSWGFNGQVEYGDKSTVWMLYGISVLMFPLFFIIPKIDPKGKSYEKIDGFYSVFRLVMVVFLIGMLELVIFSAENAHRFNIGKIAMIALSLLMIFMGNYLPKCKHNYTMGIKTMWTYADERVWNDTHRFGGMLFFVSGIISLVATLLLSEILYFVIGIGTVLITIVVTTVYSYFSYKKYNG